MTALSTTVAPPEPLLHRRWAQTLLPFGTSLAVHAGVLIVGLLFVGAYRVVQTHSTQLQEGFALSSLVDDHPPGETMSFGGGDPLRPLMQDKDPTQGSKQGWADHKSPSIDLTAGGGGGDQASILGVGPMSGFGRGSANGLGRGAGTAPGEGNGGPMSPFGLPNGGSGPRSPVFDTGRPAREVVFVCDATGSMLNKLATLKDELNKAVVHLRPTQSFDILFFQEPSFDSFSKQLLPATPENKRKAGQYLEGIVATGPTDPVPALEMALRLRPRLIYFLTDAADFPNPQAVTATIARFNADRQIRINTILFVEDRNEHEKNFESERLMKSIADNSGGGFRWVEMDAIQH